MLVRWSSIAIENVKLLTVHNTRKNVENELAAELHDEALFKEPPPPEDCPICFTRIPTLCTGSKYKTCCGKTICSGCSYAPRYDNQGNEVDIEKQNECPFCRVVAPKSDEEIVNRMMKRVDAEDPIAIFSQGTYYDIGMHGFSQDYNKALELYHRAAELGHIEAYNNIGAAYTNGKGVKRDKKKARHYYELAAMGGSVIARYNLGLDEKKAGNLDRALKHYMIAIRDGDDESLKKIQEMYKYKKGHATKEDYMKALQSIKNTWVRLRVPRGMKLLH